MRNARRLRHVVIALVVFVAACGGDDEADTTTTTTGSTTTTSTIATTTTTLIPQGEILVGRGDAGPLVRSLQFLLLCNGFERAVVDGRDEDLSVDGVYGAITGAFVAQAQESLGFRADPGGVSGAVLLALGAACDDVRTASIVGESMTTTVRAYLDPNVDDQVTIRVAAGQTMTVAAEVPLTIGVTAPSGAVVAAPASTTRVVVEAAETGNYIITTQAGAEGLFTYTIKIPPPPSALVLQSTGLDFVDFGDPMDDVIETLTAILGPPTNDSGFTDAGGQCVNHRILVFGDAELFVAFTDAATDKGGDDTFANEGVQHFAQWRSQLPSDPENPLLPEFETPSGLAVGDTAEDVAEVYGDRVEVEEFSFSILEGVITGELGPAPQPADNAGEDDTTTSSTEATTTTEAADAAKIVLSMQSGAMLCEAQD